MTTSNNKKNTSRLSQSIKILLATFVICTISTLAYAQGPGLPGNQDADSVPLDGGLTLCVAAGIGYGIKKLKGRQPEKQKDI